MKEERIKFICPECAGKILVAIQSVTESMDISHVYDGNLLVGGDVLESFIEDIKRFICNSCGYEISDNERDTIKWLRDHGMLEDEKD